MNEERVDLDDLHQEVAISFAAPQRACARRLAAGLEAMGIRALLDERSVFDPWNEDPEAYAARIHGALRPLVVLVSRDYCRIACSRPGTAEILARALQGHPCLTIVRFDDAGIPAVTFERNVFDARRSAENDLHRILLLRMRTLSVLGSPRRAGSGPAAVRVPDTGI